MELRLKSVMMAEVKIYWKLHPRNQTSPSFWHQFQYGHKLSAYVSMLKLMPKQEKFGFKDVPHCNLHCKIPQVNAVRAEKQYMIDHLGAQYLDCISNIAHVGHSHPQVVSALQSQFSKLATSEGLTNEKCTAYMRQLVNHLPDSLCMCYLVNSGSEANDLALRLARNYTKNKDVLVFDDAYHGNLGSTVDISPKMLKEIDQQKEEYVHVLPVPDTFKGAYKEDNPLACEKYITDVKKTLSSLAAGSRRLACFISEMFVVSCGIVVPPKNYFKHLYESVRDVGGVCIADEVQTGLGRLGEHMWAFQYFGVTPDIVTIGKPLGNGYPMAAVITTAEIANSLAGEYYSTFGGNPVACAVGRTVLEIIHNEKLMASGKAVGKTLMEGLVHLKSRHECVGDVRGMGLCIGIEIVRDKVSRKPDGEAAENIILSLKESHHILIQALGPHKNVLSVMPPMCFTQQNARSLVSALDEVISSMDSNTPTCGVTPSAGPSLNLGITSPVITPESLLLGGSPEHESASEYSNRRKKRRTSYDDVD